MNKYLLMKLNAFLTLLLVFCTLFRVFSYAERNFSVRFLDKGTMSHHYSIQQTDNSSVHKDIVEHGSLSKLVVELESGFPLEGRAPQLELVIATAIYDFDFQPDLSRPPVIPQA